MNPSPDVIIQKVTVKAEKCNESISLAELIRSRSAVERYKDGLIFFSTSKLDSQILLRSMSEASSNSCYFGSIFAQLSAQSPVSISMPTKATDPIHLWDLDISGVEQ